MGNSTLKKDTFIRLRERGEWEHYIITDDNSTWHQYVEYERIPKGAQIHQCVWKGGNLEVRKVITKKDGPATYVPKPPMTHDELNALALKQQEDFLQGLKDTKQFAGMFLPGLDANEVDALANEVIELQERHVEKLKKMMGKS